MTNRKLVAALSLICVIALAFPVFAHEDSAYRGQQRSTSLEECRSQGSGYGKNHAGSDQVRSFYRNGKGNERETTRSFHNGHLNGRKAGVSSRDTEYSGQGRMNRNNNGSDPSIENRNLEKGNLKKGSSVRVRENMDGHHPKGDGLRDGSGRNMVGFNGQGSKWGTRDGSGPGTGFKDGLHRNRK